MRHSTDTKYGVATRGSAICGTIDWPPPYERVSRIAGDPFSEVRIVCRDQVDLWIGLIERVVALRDFYNANRLVLASTSSRLCLLCTCLRNFISMSSSFCGTWRMIACIATGSVWHIPTNSFCDSFIVLCVAAVTHMVPALH